MTTTWVPLMRTAPRQWLLTNGETLTEPELEETTTGRKVRIAAMPHLNAYSRDLEELLQKAVKALAEQRGADTWMQLTTPKAVNEALGYDPRTQRAKLHLLDPDRHTDATRLWWHFRHESLPIEAYITVTLTDVSRYPYYASKRNGQQQLTVRLTAPDTRPNSVANSPLRQVDAIEDLSMDATWTQRQLITDWARASNAIPDVLQEVALATERDGAGNLLQTIARLEELDHITLPDLRLIGEGLIENLQLHLVGSNVTGEFLAELRDFVDGAPSISEAATHYRKMLQALRMAGMVFDEPLTENEFLSALVSGSQSALTMKLHALDLNSQDNDHTLTVHLTTGTIVVECSIRARENNKDEIAHAWEESLALASLTGQEDTLLAYARKFVNESEHKRATEIIQKNVAARSSF